MQMRDKVPHVGIVYGALGLGFSCVISRFVVWKNPNDMNVVYIFEGILRGVDKLAAKNEV